jgi:hypothetical protein
MSSATSPDPTRPNDQIPGLFAGAIAALLAGGEARPRPRRSATGTSPAE